MNSIKASQRDQKYGKNMWRRFELVLGACVTEEQVLEVIENKKLDRSDLAIILSGLRVRPGIDPQALGIRRHNSQAHPLD